MSKLEFLKVLGDFHKKKLLLWDHDTWLTGISGVLSGVYELRPPGGIHSGSFDPEYGCNQVKSVFSVNFAKGFHSHAICFRLVETSMDVLLEVFKIYDVWAMFVGTFWPWIGPK